MDKGFDAVLRSVDNVIARLARLIGPLPFVERIFSQLRW